jgi:hypothetical protein
MQTISSMTVKPDPERAPEDARRDDGNDGYGSRWYRLIVGLRQRRGNRGDCRAGRRGCAMEDFATPPGNLKRNLNKFAWFGDPRDQA